MPVKRLILILTVLVALIAINLFLYYSNDHVECDVKVVRSVGKNGEEVTTTTHVCHERFSF
ncbi:MAG: hypothetical protein JNK18_05805 [Cyclobacteriaceae bacterium]|nr:hypothetical protein [Cyclobacteriaceae bacterium]